MRGIEKLIGQLVSSVFILIIGFMIVSELVKQSQVLQNLSFVFYILFLLMVVAIVVKIYDYFRR